MRFGVQGVERWAKATPDELPLTTERNAPGPAPKELTDRDKDVIRDYIDLTLKSGRTVNYGMLQHHLAESKCTSLSSNLLRTRLQALGYCWGPAKVVARANMELPEWGVRRGLYALSYARVLALQREGTAKLVYMDESFVNVRHKRPCTLYHPDTTQSNRVNAGVGKGELLIMVHAITDDGLLAVRDEKGEYLRPDYSKSGAQDSCEMIYRSKAVPTVDYHNHMDGEMVYRWCKERLFPVFRKVYGATKQLILVLDNAKIHHERGPNSFSPSAANKPELISKLLDWGIESVTVSRTHKVGRGKEAKTKTVETVMHSRVWEKQGGKSAPTRDELALRAKEHLIANPHLNKSRLQLLFEEEVSVSCLSFLHSSF